MKRPRLVVVAAVLAALIGACFEPSTMSRAQIAAVTAFLVVPRQVHPGDAIYISGSGFDPGKRLAYITTACPNITEANDTIATTLTGPLPGRNGQFTSFKLHPPNANNLKQKLGCQVYTPVGTNPYGPDVPGSFIIVPPGEPIERCSRTMCITLKTRPEPVRSGFKESIAISRGWPGARGTIIVTYPGTSLPRQTTSLQLDWTGAASHQVVVSTRVTRTIKATVTVRMHFGAVTAQASRKFTVIH